VSRLYLLRHAKAQWASPGMRDFDRPLEESGRVDAGRTGIQMRLRGYVPDVTLCSTAVRARETLQEVAGEADTGRVVFDARLYSEDAAFYLDLVRENASGGSIMVVGHNPMMEDLATALSGDGESAAIATLGLGFPTAGLAVIGFPAGLDRVAPGKGRLEAFVVPGGN
jgi:phosphohistidine phosphatase